MAVMSPPSVSPPVTAPTVLYDGVGRLLGYIVSHADAGVVTVNFYDNTAVGGTLLHRVHIHPERSPFYVFIPRWDGRGGIRFETGLAVDPSVASIQPFWVGYE